MTERLDDSSKAMRRMGELVEQHPKAAKITLVAPTAQGRWRWEYDRSLGQFVMAKEEGGHTDEGVVSNVTDAILKQMGKRAQEEYVDAYELQKHCPYDQVYDGVVRYHREPSG